MLIMNLGPFKIVMQLISVLVSARPGQLLYLSVFKMYFYAGTSRLPAHLEKFNHPPLPGSGGGKVEHSSRCSPAPDPASAAASPAAALEESPSRGGSNARVKVRAETMVSGIARLANLSFLEFWLSTCNYFCVWLYDCNFVIFTGSEER